MLLPKDILSGTYRKPDVYLCETDKTKICKLDTTNMQGTFKFNSYSELSFDVARVYNDIITSQTRVNPYYNKIEALRLILLEGFGYFELQDPDIDSDGIKEIKSLTAYSLEYTLSQKYLELFKANMGTVDSIEVMYAENNNNGSIVPITFYNETNPELSLLHLILEKIYGWKIGHVDPSLKTMSRQFEVDRESVYDFIMNEICDKFNCYAVFDTVNNTINFYAETSVNKFTGDGSTTTFTVYPAFVELGTVSVDGYKTTNYKYNNTTGELELLDEKVPELGQIIEVTDGSLASWETDVYVSFDNLAQQMGISYSADDIKTVLTVKGADDLDIREVNNGLPYIVDLSYFYNVDWMGQDLYNKYTDYLLNCASVQADYKANSQKILELANKISYETNRLSLQFSKASVTSDTVGTYYVRGGNADTGYTYIEVSLPADYVAGTVYYSTKTTDINEEKVSELYEALKHYYDAQIKNNLPDTPEQLNKMEKFTGENSRLAENFYFMEETTLDDLISVLDDKDSTDDDKDKIILAFFAEMWEQLGLTPLKTLYLAPYKEVQTANVSAGLSKKDHEDYGQYYPVVLIIKSLESAIKERQKTIDKLTAEQDSVRNANSEIGDSLLIGNNFTDEEMVRLSAFLREDEYTDNNFVYTGNESEEELFQLKQELLECGRIELAKLCEPCLKFSMSLANIYALPEFAPIATQFQLGNLIKVAFRPDYIKHARLMQVNLNFEDFSDFSCEFGDLSSIRSQTDLHADLLSGAVSAGKTVASSASYWDKGSDTANTIDVRLQQGLLNAATEIKAIDGTQHSFIDKYGIHLQEKDPDTGEISPEQGWIVNNKFLYSDDAFKTTKSVFGKYKIGEEEYWGLLADAVIAGYIEGSQIVGGTIQIGDRGDGSYNFEVDESGTITMIGGKGISSSGEVIDLDDYNTTVDLTATNTALTANIRNATLTCKIYSYGVDVTNTIYKDQSIFQWLRSTGYDEADEEWCASHINSPNTIEIGISDIPDETGVAFFQCKVNLPNVKYTDSIAIALNDSDVHVFTSKPELVQTDGYCYNIGDLWVVGNDYQPKGYLENTILISTANSSEYSDEHWVESVYYSKTFQDLNDRTTELEEHVVIDSEGLHLRASSNDDSTFESLLASKRLSFGTWSAGKHNEVVWIGTDSMAAKDTVIMSHLDVTKESEDADQDVYVNIGGYRKEIEDGVFVVAGGFKLKIESNGSLSIV